MQNGGPQQSQERRRMVYLLCFYCDAPDHPHRKCSSHPKYRSGSENAVSTQITVYSQIHSGSMENFINKIFLKMLEILLKKYTSSTNGQPIVERIIDKIHMCIGMFSEEHI